MKVQSEVCGAGIPSFLHTLFNFSTTERGGIELAVNVIPSLSNEVYARRLCTQDKLPHRKVGGRYLFTRFELESWMAEGAPIPASAWAEEFRQRDYVSGL
ncbi:MAG: helix-turn-helix domain-containing protein, partial [Phaeodactylibacter sp.]|nr:helix-turn-helix domain-containing protein [Phaeodactylibacter sp.]